MAKNSKVVTNIDDNKMILFFTGVITRKELDNLYTDVRFGVSDLQPGFNVISDFSNCKLLYLNGLGSFRKIFNFILTNDSGELVRVLQPNRLIQKQLLNLALRGQGYKPIYAPTIEEAESKLENSVKREGLRFHLRQHPVEYMIGDVKNKGNIINISISGCAIMPSNSQPKINSEVVINFVLNNQSTSPNTFSINARVVRIESYTFAVSFTGLDKKIKNDLWKSIVLQGK